MEMALLSIIALGMMIAGLIGFVDWSRHPNARDSRFMLVMSVAAFVIGFLIIFSYLVIILEHAYI